MEHKTLFLAKYNNKKIWAKSAHIFFVCGKNICMKIIDECDKDLLQYGFAQKKHQFGICENILSIKTDLGGRRGVINVISDVEIPYSSHALVEVYDDADNLINDYMVSVKNGLGYYNSYTRSRRI